MAWTDLSFPSGSKLTSTKMTEVQSNFAALAAGEPGAPPLAVGSLMWSGVASGAFLNVSSGLQTTGVGSFGALSVGGIQATGVGSFGLLDAGSGYQTTGVGSFGSVNVSSGMVLGPSPSTPPANEAFRESIAKAWVSFDGTGTVSINDSFNVSGLTDNGVGDYTITWDTDFADATYAMGLASISYQVDVGTVAAGSVQIRTLTNGFSASDYTYNSVIAIGDQ